MDEEVEGTTENFDIIEMNTQIHEYVKLPKVTNIKTNSKKQRMREDENTKKYFIDDKGRRATSDVGGSKVARGIENRSLYEIEAQGELSDFINILKILESFREIKAVNVASGLLPRGREKKKFSYLEDEITNRKYIVAIVELFNGKRYRVLEIERENRSLSILILSTKSNVDWTSIIQNALMSLVDKNGTWLKEIITYIETKGVTVKKIKHSRKNVYHKAENLLKKLLNTQ
ncbi:Tn7-like element transposition protein TnsE [Pullulanibacillus sp. KACC 23026]|uniref:Tn7-like element transposition protein TnsE n=1 Tax=Pullulanibacillus sp. KACC 23026 TaxID=3028315 RepID=UPI0023B10F03|nr:Tn7-like element transposition protein TnsE [Pullulanibacillus sp. KACC 23026]WEG12604.1 Tn7-like element transposition protein TnsE [Pullulanibacillus sp. KACC 23026]